MNAPNGIAFITNRAAEKNMDTRFTVLDRICGYRFVIRQKDLTVPEVEMDRVVIQKLHGRLRDLDSVHIETITSFPGEIMERESHA